VSAAPLGGGCRACRSNSQQWQQPGLGRHRARNPSKPGERRAAIASWTMSSASLGDARSHRAGCRRIPGCGQGLAALEFPAADRPCRDRLPARALYSRAPNFFNGVPQSFSAASRVFQARRGKVQKSCATSGAQALSAIAAYAPEAARLQNLECILSRPALRLLGLIGQKPRHAQSRHRRIQGSLPVLTLTGSAPLPRRGKIPALQRIQCVGN